MTDQPILTHIIHVHQLPAGGETIEIGADEKARKEMAQAYGVKEVTSFRAQLTAKPSGRDSVAVSGRIEADIVQICGVTLDPFPVRMEEDVNMLLAPPQEASEEDEEAVENLDLPDPLLGNTIDLGAIALEFFALGIDPYPRKPGIEFTDHVESEEQENPFAALAKLRLDDQKKQ
ncbi:phosphodiesterase [Agaricicola taiwanensis]|uniref:Phosphodiesterase n=1 Tax=Agaricicola taiwanensis TaxID=591372 RepID=A0A8J2YIT4_9RHOB|nr:DUF177 domain-containing protein [Agaricicola taiwanensis]GGE46298.1 phosphodiesterase [Agaricicola taiwanensis]